MMITQTGCDTNLWKLLHPIVIDLKHLLCGCQQKIPLTQ